MKKFVFLLLLCVGGCVVAGDFPENRNRLHSMGNDSAYCDKNPDKCVNGVPW